MQHHNNVQCAGAELSVPAGAVELVRHLEDVKTHGEHCKLLYDKETDEYPHGVIRRRNADYHCRLRQLIGEGVEELAEVRDHVETPCDEAVKHIAHPRDDEYAECVGVVILHIQDHENGYEDEPQIAEHIGKRKRLLLDFLFVISFVVAVCHGPYLSHRVYLSVIWGLNY